jgi:hypothetical protein
MKKLLFIAVFAIGFTGCQKHENGKDIDESWTKHDFFNRTKIVDIEGHKYIILNGYNSGGIIHAESCKCKNR